MWTFWNIFSAPRDLQTRETRQELKPGRVRLTNRMKTGIQALFIMVLAGTLATSALVCPLWISSISKADSPCSNHDDSPEQCPILICQASAPYLADGQSDHGPFLQELSPAVVNSTILQISFKSTGADHQDDESPPGVTVPLFLRAHAFLI